MKIIALMITIIVAIGVLLTLSQPPVETYHQRLERVCGDDNDCKLREDLRVIATQEHEKQEQQDQEMDR